jgi:WD40 repeat protein
MLSIAQSMAVKSTQMRTDTLLKGLLAFQAYHFNTDNGGISYDPDIFRAVYGGLSFFKGSSFNVFQGHTSIIWSLLQDNQAIFSGGSDGQLISWNTADKTPTVLMSGLPIIKKLVSDKSSVLCITTTGIIRYDTKSKSSDNYLIPSSDIKDFFITKNGEYLMVLNESIFLAKDYKSPGVEFYKSDVKINSTKYDIRNGFLFAALSDGRILYWKDINADKDHPVQLARIADANWGDINYDPVKDILAAGTGNKEGSLYLWKLASKEQTQILRGHTARITEISFSDDGLLMASASYDGSVRIWHMDNLNVLPVVFDDHGTWVTSIMFTRDNNFIYSGDKNGNIRQFPVGITGLVNDYCQFLTRDLTEGEWQNYVGTDIPYKPNKCNK